MKLCLRVPEGLEEKLISKFILDETCQTFVQKEEKEKEKRIELVSI